MNTDKLRELKEAIKISQELYDIRSKDCGNIPSYALSIEAKALLLLIDFAEHFLSSPSELPKKIPEIEIPVLDTADFNADQRGRILRYIEVSFRSRFAHGQNVVLDIAEVVVAKKNMRIEELEEVLREAHIFIGNLGQGRMGIIFDKIKSALEFNPEKKRLERE